MHEASSERLIGNKEESDDKKCSQSASCSQLSTSNMLPPFAYSEIPLSELRECALSFSGAGFLASYHFGVTSCLLKNGQDLLNRVTRVAGCSAGSLCAALLVLAPHRLEEARHDMSRLAAEVRLQRFGALTPGYYLHERVTALVDKYIPHNIESAQDRLVVSVTERAQQTNRLLSSFGDRDELMTTLTASCFIPFYSGMGCPAPKIGDEEFVDGGLTNNLPRIENLRTVAVSPFASTDARISPTTDSSTEWKITFGQQSINLNSINRVRAMDALFPPKPEVIEHYYNEGFADAFRFLIQERLIRRQTGTAV